jgi:hypothetical protein
MLGTVDKSVAWLRERYTCTENGKNYLVVS